MSPALIQSFTRLGAHYPVVPSRRDYHREASRKRRERYYAMGLNSQGKPYGRRPNFFPKISHTEYTRQYRASGRDRWYSSKGWRKRKSRAVKKSQVRSR